MGFSSACQAKTQSKVVEDVDSVAAWTSNLIFQVGRAAVAGMCGGTGGRGGGMVVVVVVGIVGGVGRRWRVGGARGGGGRRVEPGQPVCIAFALSRQLITWYTCQIYWFMSSDRSTSSGCAAVFGLLVFLRNLKSSCTFSRPSLVRQ